MKSVSTTLKNHIRTSDTVQAVPQLIAEWNLNRYFPTYIDNIPSDQTDGYDIELFPIEEVVKPHRPPRGINKGILGQFSVGQRYVDAPPVARYYAASADDPYKYWVSGSYSSSAAPYNFPVSPDPVTNVALTAVRPRLDYGTWNATKTTFSGRPVTMNKIVIGFETTWSKPDDIEVWTRPTYADDWVQIAVNPTVGTDGRVVLYHNGTGWGQTLVRDAGTTVQAIEVRVNSMDKPNSQLMLIELSGRLELDLSDDLVTDSDTFTMSEPDFITPLGQISSNTGSLTLFNETGWYTNDNTSSPYYSMIGRFVKFTKGYNYVLPDGSTEYVQEYVMYSDEWDEDEPNINVSLVDASVILQTEKPKPCLYEKVSVQQIAWQLCDQVGFADYAVTTVPTAGSTIVQHFYTKGDETVWDILQSLARSTQTAFYFDAYGILQIKTRDAAFDSAKTPVWTARRDPFGTEQPDIIKFSPSTKYEANKVNVSFAPTSFSEWNNGLPVMDIMWEPSDDDVVLRASPLRANLLTSDVRFFIPAEDAVVWPFEGMVNIEGEFVGFKGKAYRYYPTSTTAVYTTVNSQEEKEKLDQATPVSRRYLNSYTGGMVITERGMWNTQPANHYVDANGWTEQRFFKGSTSTYNSMTFNPLQSSVTLHTGSTFTQNDYAYALRGASTDAGFYYMGTRFKIEPGSEPFKGGGIVLNLNGTEQQGYYIEIRPTSRFVALGSRASSNELTLYSKQANSVRKVFGGEKGTGVPANIVEGVWYDLDVQIQPGATDVITVMLNGQVAFQTSVPAGQWHQPWGGRFAMYVRGYSRMTFEYIYAIGRNDVVKVDAENYLDRIYGGYIGSQWDRDWVWNWRSVRRRVKKKWVKEQIKTSQRFFDEFGPIVHEARKFDITFDDELPALHSRIYLTNDYEVICPEYFADPYHAHFYLANTSRSNAIVQGEDTLRYAAADTSVNQRVLIYGRKLQQKDTQIITKSNDDSIKARGVVELDFESQWTQTTTEANALADWIVNHWKNSDSEADLELFGNPLFELGDVIAIEYNDYHASSYLYFVTGITTSWDNGITTNLTLKRVSV